MMIDSRKNKKTKLFAMMLMAVMIVCGAVFTLSLGEAKAAPTAVTESIDLVTGGNSNIDKWNSEGWKWNMENNTLTLADGFKLQQGSDVKPALTLRAGTTIILEGEATITSNQKGIETTGNLTIKSAEKKKGYLKIKINNDAPNGYYYYGIEIKNDNGTKARTLSVTDHTILEVDSTGTTTSTRNGALFCSATSTEGSTAGQTVASNKKATLEITNQSAVQLRNATSVAKGFKLKSTDTNRILFIVNGTTPSLIKAIKDISDGQKDITMMSCDIEGTYDTAATTNYSLTYDGKDHPVLLNTEDETDGRLKKLGTHIDPIVIKPVNFDYYESQNSEFLDDGSDYREKNFIKTTTQYTNFNSSGRGKLINAATYNITYKDTPVAKLIINQREIEITGLKAKNKTYDGWPDAQIDYSNIKYTCVNDYNNYDSDGNTVKNTRAGTVNKTGIVKNDENKIGSDIIPYAKAYFVAVDGGGTAINNPFGDGTNYKQSKDVAYNGNGTSAQNTVAVKKVCIDNGKIADGTTEGLPTGVTLSDPNYKVMTPAASGEKKSQIKTEAIIYPRSLSDTDNISCVLTPNKVKWNTNGYLEGTDIVETLTDISSKTPANQGAAYTVKLNSNTDYIVNPNTVKVYEVGEYEIIITGCGNYTGTIRPKWSIERAVREITITEPDNRAYDGNSYPVTTTGDFKYVIKDVSDPSHKLNITDSLEDGSNLSITYVGRNTTDYPESETAPTNAGDYTVKVKVFQTERYTAAEETLDYTIYAKTVSVDWTCSGGELDTTVDEPETYIYNGTPNVFSAKVTNVVDGDTVTVESVTYKNTTTNAVLTAAPKDAGNYSVSATTLSNPNYTVNSTKANNTACPAHNYVISKAVVGITWDVSGSPYTYDATDHTPKATVNDLQENSDGVQDVVTVTKWSFSDNDGNPINDVLNKQYLQANGAVNVSNGDITITATELSDTNYKLPEAAECSAKFRIIPCDLSKLTIGTADSHDGAQIWAAKQYFTGKIEEPEIVWVSGAGEKELKNDAPNRTNYAGYSDAAKAKLVEGYTASLNTEALEYNNSEKGLEVKITGTKNFVNETTLKWNVEKIDSGDVNSKVEIKINNYAATVSGTVTTPYTITYGTACPKVDFSYENEDIKKNIEKGVDPYVSYLYTGTMKNGETYESDKAPTQAGTYNIKVTLAETDHYKSVSDNKDFIISQKEVTVDNILAVDKQYDGTKTASLNFKNSTWTGASDDNGDGEVDDITAADKEAIKAALSTAEDTGFVTYKAEFADKDVKWTKNAALADVIDTQNVTISNLAINETKGSGTPDILYNFKIAANGNQTTAVNAKILQRELSVSGIKGKDKVYDGSKEAVLDYTGMKIDGKVSNKDASGKEVEESLDITVSGEFEDDPVDAAIKAKDVKLVENKPAAKKIKLKYDEDNIVTEDNNVKIKNYTIKADSQKDTEAAITPATLTITGLKAVDKDYDGTANVTLDWENTSVDGILAGDIIEVDKAGNKAAWGADKFSSSDVAYNKNGEVIDKTGTITKTAYTVKFTNASIYTANNYTVADVAFSGKIRPKKIKGIAWTYDKNKLGDIPTADFETNSGILEGEKCEPVVNYYLATDAGFANAITKAYMVDNQAYVAKVISVSNKNYEVDDTDAHISYAFTFDSDKDNAELEITNYQKTADGKAYSIVYGDALPEVKITDKNTDKDKHYTYLYTGKSLDGTAYEDSKPPVNAGSYKLTVKLAATDHFAEAEAKAAFTIEPRTLTITRGVTVEDKVYNGTDKATLSFKKVVFDDVIESDEAAFATLFASGEHIRYNANFESKNVKYAETVDNDGEAESVVSGQSVTAKDFSFIYNEGTPAMLYNYTISTKGNNESLYGKIMPRPVTVTGITAKNKTYDGTDKATLVISKAEFSGKLKGDSLTVEAVGSFKVTGNETNAADVLMDDKGVVGLKNVTIDSMELVAGDNTTKVDNYILSDGSNEMIQAKILPKAVTIKSGIKAKDKVYNNSTVTDIDFTDVAFAGTVNDDAKKLKELVNVEGSNYVAYKANFASKDVVYSAEDKTVADVNVTASDYYFVIDENTPQIMKNYVIAQDGNQAELKAKIMPRPVKVTGIKAKDKIYDGNAEAILDLEGITFTGHMEGDSLKVTVKGTFVKTEDEAAEAVLMTPEGDVCNKKVSIIISNLEAGDETTNINNYCLAEDGQQTETTAAINPLETSPAEWSIDDKTGLPVAVSEENSELSDDAKAVVKYYEESDTEFTTPIDEDKLVSGKDYVARIEYVNSNYQADKESETYTYKFTYVDVVLEKAKEEQKAKEEAEKAKAEEEKAKEEAKKAEAEEQKLKEAEKKAKEAEQKAKEAEQKAKETETKTDVNITPATEAPQTTVDKEPTTEEKEAAVLALNEGLSATVKSNKLTFKWGMANGVDGYNVYTTTGEADYGDPVKLTGVNSYTYKVDTKKKVYYMYVEAFKVVNGEETVLAKSKELVWAGSKTKGVNAKVVKVSKKKLTVGVKKKVALKASIVVSKKVGKVNRTQTIKGKKAGLTYWSTDKKVATVSSKGKIKGVKAGTCYIYVMAKDGKKQKVKVTVK